MPYSKRIFVSVCFGLIAFAVVYLLEPPMPDYYPVASTWSYSDSPPGPAMGWYGRSLAGLVAALGIGLLTGLLLRRRQAHDSDDQPASPTSNRSIHLLTTLTLALLLALMIKIIWTAFHEWHVLG